MSENGNPPVAVESPEHSPETLGKVEVETAVEPDAAPTAEAAATEPGAQTSEPGAESSEPAAQPDEPVAQAAPAETGEPAGDATAAPEPAAEDAEEPAAGAEASAESPAAKKRARKPRRRRTARSEEFVAPTPEDLEGLTSEAVRHALDAGEPIEGTIIGWNQGGFHVVVDGMTAFCPRSSMERGAPHEPARYLDQTFEFRILRVEEKGRRLVLSRTAALRDERKRLADATRASLEVGAVMEGRVVALTDFGAFVDLGGVEGLIHVSELRHGRVAKPSDVLEAGQTVRVKIVKLGAKGERVSLSVKALEPDPWTVAAETWKSGAKFSGKVLRKADFGWFVELAPGIEGLLHVSQLLPGMKEDDPSLQPGAEIEGWVRELDPRRHRISLSLRETPTGNPWEGVTSRYKEGAAVTGTVEKVERFGAFIQLEPGLTGLLPTSEMGLPRGASVAKAYQVGKQVKLQISQVDARRKRISLTLEGKTLEGSRTDYRDYLKKSGGKAGLSTLAAAFERLKSHQP